ncbi:MAG: M20/M25/M40 family metallo-hydrolase [Elusimicrobiota bacterium]|jgi:acetylornithine deacetylase/succinyl-diaminopimelate desuccinylase-like protein
MLKNALQHARKDRQKTVAELSKLAAIPSCSFAGFPPAELKRAADATADLLRRSGLEHVKLVSVPGAPPYVYADWLHAPGKPTLLLYAHYDVQPVGDVRKWKSPPYKPTIRAGRLFGRGTADDKAGIVVHAASVAAWIKTSGKLPVNVKVLIEGEEECGGSHLDLFLKKNKKLIMSDVMVIADCGNAETGLPSVTTSLRGLVAMDVTVSALDHSLHSGMWGGPLADPVQALAKMIASLSLPDGRIAIPGIYKGVRPLSRVEKESHKALRFIANQYRKQAGLLPGVEIVGGKAGPLEKMWRLPAVSVNAIEASSRKECANIVNGSAWCHLGIRTVPGMDNARVLKLLKAHLLKNAPWGVKVEFSNIGTGPWWTTDPESEVFRATNRALSAGYGKKTVYVGTGGSIPFVGELSEAMGGAPALLVGVEDPYSNPHSENESLDLSDLQKSVESSVRLYDELSRVKKVK